MKRTVIVFSALMMLALGSAKAQIRYVYDPFANGDKYFGLEAGIGGWLSSSETKIVGYTTNYEGYSPNQLKRTPFNPSVAIIYKRVLEGNTISVGNTYRMVFNWWHGTVEGTSLTNPANTFTTTFNYRTAELSDIYYAMIPIGDQISVNVGGGLTIGANLSPKSTIEFSDGSTAVNTQGGTDFMDLLTATIDFIVGVDYKLNDSFTLSCNLYGQPIDFFGLFEDDNVKGLRGVGDGLFVSKKFPYHLTLGFTYML